MGAAQSTPVAPSQPSPVIPAGCPMHQSSSEASSSSPLDPRNNIPSNLAQAPAAGQKIVLPLERTISSIPKAEHGSPTGQATCPVDHSQFAKGGKGKAAEERPAPPERQSSWEYPSPQQFYNALVRKGWETPEESVEMMVHIHNWLNEEAWQQVRKWEDRHPGGEDSSLASFQGRPQDLSPKARYHMFMGKIFPETYHSIKPFDRHDWIVHRPSPAHSVAGGQPSYKTVRYVLDYYSLGNDAEGYPLFSLDVRPAVDDWEAVKDRVGEWWKAKQDGWAVKPEVVSEKGRN